MPEDPQEQQEEQERGRPRVVDKRVSARTASGETSPPAPDRAPPPEQQMAEPPPPPEPDTGGPAATDERAAPDPGDPDLWTPEQEEAARAVAREMAERPAEDWVLSSAINLANVGGTKLQVGDLEGARLAIDALGGLVNAIAGRLGEADAPLRQTLAQLQMAYAQMSAPTPPGGDPTSGS